MFDDNDLERGYETAFFSSCPVHFDDLFSGALAPLGVREQINEQTTESLRCLTDGEGRLWAVKGDGRLLEKFAQDTSSTGFVRGIVLAVEKVFGTDLSTGHEIDIRTDVQESFETCFTRYARCCCDQLCAEILTYVWNAKGQLESGLRTDLAEAVHAHVRFRPPPRTLPRSLDDVAHLLKQVLSGEARSSVRLAWTPSIEAGQVATLGWIAREIGRDEFRVAWLEEDGAAQRTLRGWALATQERHTRGSLATPRAPISRVQRVELREAETLLPAKAGDARRGAP